MNRNTDTEYLKPAGPGLQADPSEMIVLMYLMIERLRSILAPICGMIQATAPVNRAQAATIFVASLPWNALAPLHVPTLRRHH